MNGRISMLVAFLTIVCAVPGLSATLTGTTSHSNNSTYAIGETVQLLFDVAGASGGATLALDVKNERDSLIAHIDQAAPAGGTGRITANAPSQKLGFYRVYARLSTGETPAKLGSRQAGYITYCVVPDPSKRTLYNEKETFFGMQGGFSNAMNIMPYLGIRWIMGGLSWYDEEPDHSGQFTENSGVGAENGGSYNGVPWKVYTMPSLLKSLPDWAIIPGTRGNFLGALDPSQDSACARYVRAAAIAYGKAYPDRIEHVFQMTWEPSYSWAYKGTPEQLVHIYKVAALAIHSVDPKALCIGPTLFPDDYLTPELADFLDAGGGKYLDGFSMHPYAVRKQDTTVVKWLRTQKSMVFQSAGKTIPCFGTEQGWATGDTVANEIAQARGLIRQHLIMMGEGFRFNFAFYIADFDLEPGYGYYYNLNPNIQFGTDKISPKPIAPAYAALSYLLEGHHVTQCLNNNSQKVMGYVYERTGSKFTVLWTPGTGSPTYDLSTGLDSVTVYDWMGNGRKVACPNRALNLVLKQEPVYVQTAGGATGAIGSAGARRHGFVNAINAMSSGRGFSLTYTVASRGRVTIDICDLRGSRVARVVDAIREPGAYCADIGRGASMPAGRYVVRMTAGNQKLGRDLLVVR